MTIPDEVDIIVAGGVYLCIHCYQTISELTSCLGGSAGCVVAGRLAALDRNLTMLLVEGGENDLNNPWIPK